MVSWKCVGLMCAFAIFLNVFTSEAKSFAKNFNIQDAIPRSCMDTDFCFIYHNNIKLQTIIDDVIKKNKFFFEIDPKEHYVEREGVTNDIKRVCDIDRELSLAYFIRDKEDKLRVVLQSEHLKHVQHIAVNYCTKPGTLVNYSTISNDSFSVEGKLISYNHTIACEQRYYLDYRYHVLNEAMDGYDIVLTKNGVPSECVAVYHS